MVGIVRKVDFSRNFAFIRVGSSDVFVNLAENRDIILSYRDECEFDVVRIRGQLRARNLKVLDPIRHYEIIVDRHGRYEARRDSNTVIYGDCLDEVRRRLEFNPGFHEMRANAKPCDRTPAREAFYAD